MHLSDPSDAPTAIFGPAPAPPPTLAPQTPATPAQPYGNCDECGSPVDADQRYCVVCGAHRRHVHDPAARYLGLATARARTTRTSTSTTATRRAPARGRSLGAALVLAIIPVAAAVGVAVGRSSNNDDARLIQALSHRQAATVTTAPTASSAAATTAAAAAGSTHRSAAKAAHHKSAKTVKHKASSANSTTKFGTVTQITGSKPTKAQEQQGAQDTQKVQRSTGKTYVNQQNNLPGTVVVP
jgi:hypothetical protein